MSNELRVTSEPTVPHWVRAQIEKLGVDNVEVWVHSKIPALDGRCVIELVGTSDGEVILKEYFSRAIGHFGC